MPTVRGGFEIENRGAIRHMRELRREATQLDVQLRRTGSSFDRFGDKAERATLKARTGYSRMTASMERDSAKLELALDKIDSKLESISQKKPTPKIDVQGLAKANLELSAFEARLTRLDHRRVGPTLGAGIPSAGRVLGAGGGGGGFGSTGAFASTGGGIGIATSRVGLLAGAAAAALPVVQALTGAATGLAGSLGGAVLGAGVGGFPAVGGLIGGVSSIAAVAIPLKKNITAATKAQGEYNEAVAQYGRSSKEAVEAKKGMDEAFQKTPGLDRLLSQTRALGRAWTRDTKPATRSLMATLTEGVQAGRRIEPTFAGASNRVLGRTRIEAGRFGRFASGPTGRGLVNTNAAIFSQNLGEAEQIVENLTRWFYNVERAAKPFFREGMDFLEHWTAGWAKSTEDIDHLRHDTMQGWINDFKQWSRLTGATWRLLRDIFSAGTPSGNSMVAELTNTFDRWDRWIKSHPEQTRDWFERTAESTSKMANALSRVVGLLDKLATQMGPLLDQFSNLVGLASNMGLLFPGAVALGIGGFRGARGRGGAGGGAGGTGGAGGGALAFGAGMAMGRGGVGARADLSSVSYRQQLRNAGIVVSPESRAGMTGGSLSRGGGLGAALKGAGRAYWPIAAVLGGVGIAGFRGSVGERVQAGLANVVPGVSAPKTAAEMRDQGMDAALRRGGNLRSIRKRQAEIRERLAMPGAGARSLADTFAQTFGSTPTHGEAKKLKTELAQLNVQKMTVEKEVAGRHQSRARDVGSQFDEVFRKFVRRGQSEPQALRSTERIMRRQQRDEPDVKSKAILASRFADFADDLAKGHPRIRRQARKAANSITDEWRKSKSGVKVINDKIVTDNVTAYKQLKQKLREPLNQVDQLISDKFTTTQRKAIAALRGLGFSAKEARGLVRSAEGGGSLPAARQRSSGGGSTLDLNEPPRNRPLNERARGGRIAGRTGLGLTDRVPLGGGDIGARGELVLNRHTEQRVNAMLGGRTSLGREVARETRRHSDPRRQGFPRNTYARGGRRGDGGGMVDPGWDAGHERLAGSISSTVGRWANRYDADMTAGYDPGGGHVSPGHNVTGTATDMVPRHGDWDLLERGIDALTKQGLTVFYGTGGHGTSYPNHGRGNHAHIEWGGAGGIKIKGGRGGVGPAPQIGAIRLGRSGIGGAAGGMIDRSGDVYALGLRKAINKRLRKQGGGRGGGAVRGHYNMRQLEQLAGKQGFPNPHLAAAIAMAESGGDPRSENSIGATGLWQILRSAHPDWDRRGNLKNPNFNAKAAYSISSHGTNWQPWEAYTNGAYRQFMSRGGRLSPAWAGWHGQGGSFTTKPGQPVLFGAGEAGQERVSIKRARKGAAGLGGARPVHVAVNTGDIHMRGQHDVNKVMEQAAEHAAKKLLVALDGGRAGDEELME